MYSHTDNKDFVKILKGIYDAENVIPIQDSIFSHKPVNLVICNNRLDVIQECVGLCYYYHSPLLIVDHKNKPEHAEIVKPNITNYQISISNNIAKSWGPDLCDQKIEINLYDSKNLEEWKQAIDNILNQPFKVKRQVYEKEYSDISG